MAEFDFGQGFASPMFSQNGCTIERT